MKYYLRMKTWDNGAPIWAVWSSGRFIGYVESGRGGFTGYNAYSLCPSLKLIGRFERKSDAAKAAVKAYQQ